MIKLESTWLEIEDSDTASVFQSKDWLEVWWKHFGGKESELVRLGVYEGSSLIGVANLERKDGVLMFLGTDLGDFGDIAATKGNEEKVWRQLLEYGSFQLENIRQESQSFKAIQQAADALGMKMEMKQQQVSPYIKLPKSWGEYLDQLEGRKKKELLRKMRKTGSFKFEMSGIEAVDELIKLIKLSSAQKRVFMQGRTEVWFRDMVAKFMSNGSGKIFSLRRGEQMVASVFGFEWRRGWYLYNGGYDAGTEVYAPGITLSAKIIEAAIERDVMVVDFLRGDERYKYDLGAKEQQLWQLTLGL